MENEDLRKRLIEKAKMGIKEAYSSEEYVLMQAINAYLELTKVYNLINERMEEWSGIYIPDVKIGSPTILANLIIEISSGKIDNEAIIKIMGSPEKGKRVFESLSNNTGRKIESGEEIEVIKSFAEHSLSTQKLIEMLESYIKGASNRMMPNLSYLTDEKMAAEMLSKAGTLERLATFPASTLQLLGAEKALFKHIKYGSRPPKYGILFKLPAVTNAPKQLKGKVARAYAAKLAIALKGDFFSKRFIADQLKADLDKSMKKIRETNTKPKKPAREENKQDKGYQTRREGQRDYSERKPYRSQTDSKNEEGYQTRKDYGSRRFDNKNYNKNRNDGRNQTKSSDYNAKRGEGYQTRRNPDQRNYSERKPYKDQNDERDQTKSNMWKDRKKYLGKRKKSYRNGGRRGNK